MAVPKPGAASLGIDIGTILSLLPTVLQAASIIKQALDLANTNGDVLRFLQQQAPHVLDILHRIGMQLFPDLDQEVQTVGGAIAAFDPNTVKWVQGACDNILGNELAEKLVVDGIYGPKTKAAVTQVQKKLGLDIDGVAGQLTQAAISAWMLRAQMGNA